uniref:Uncharacterized protein n=1 Tax=Anguilla anguilla TaxID=7936 RepID=A0A0E9VBL6_ANGAN
MTPFYIFQACYSGQRNCGSWNSNY